MADPAPRVVVLGRPGDAQQQLQHALDELGAHTIAVGDFDQLSPAKIREQRPEVWLVSMDETLDAAGLERWQPLFDEPEATVIFDDADVTSRLSGWDLARWARHLAAKVRGGVDVLPPVHPDAERLPQSSAVDSDAADEIQHAESDAQTVAGHDTVNPDSVKGDSLKLDALELEPLEFEATGLDSTSHDSTNHDPIDFAAHESDAHPALSGHSELSLENDADFAALSASFDAERKQRDADTDENPVAVPLDDLLRASSSDATEAPSEKAPAAAASGGTPAAASALSGLSLMDMDVDLSAPRAARVEVSDGGIDTSHLALQPLEDESAESPTASDAAGTAAPKVATSPNAGLIAIVAGLGGPDAVRQFIGALPEKLKVPVLLWQHLDAGKHDRLAQQLGKATKLPVYLAKSGEIAKQGSVGVMGAGMAITGDSGWWFDGKNPGTGLGLADALGDPATTVVVLSGAEAAIVDPARAHGANGGQVLVQTPSTCFDATAASALEKQHGVTAGSPAELAALAAKRWLAA